MQEGAAAVDDVGDIAVLVFAGHEGSRTSYLGPVRAAARSELFDGAYALLHLIDFDEPFGFSVAEAVACGTPVVAYDRGSMRELIDHGETGFVVNGADAASLLAST